MCHLGDFLDCELFLVQVFSVRQIVLSGVTFRLSEGRTDERAARNGAVFERSGRRFPAEEHFPAPLSRIERIRERFPRTALQRSEGREPVAQTTPVRRILQPKPINISWNGKKMVMNQNVKYGLFFLGGLAVGALGAMAVSRGKLSVVAVSFKTESMVWRLILPENTARSSSSRKMHRALLLTLPNASVNLESISHSCVCSANPKEIPLIPT